jgi:hypothetical protein
MKKNYNKKPNYNNKQTTMSGGKPTHHHNNKQFNRTQDREPLISEEEKIILKEIENEKKYKPPESWVKKLVPCIPRIISRREITKEEYNAHYGIY